MIVMKFGGTSVESAAAIERVAGIVRAREDRRPVVVVSAMGKTTNKLLALASAAIQGRRQEYIQQLHDLRDFHSREARKVVPLEDRAELDRTLDEHFQELTELVKGLAVLGELTPRSIDAISSYGERLSSYIVTLAFRHFGMRAEHLDSRKVIITDKRHTQAAPLYAETYKRLAQTIPALAEHAVVVMGGFIGSTEEGVTSTLGRGGSDFTASLVGAGIGAAEIQIWTDVDGMLTADPTILPGGHRVKTISFAEAAELAYFGAKVLHPATVVPAIEKNIPVLILNSRRPEVDGTRIVSESVHCGNAVKSIACKRKITLVNIHSTRMLMAHGFLRRIFEVFDRFETPVDVVATSEVSVSLTIDNPRHLEAIRAELREFAEVEMERDQAIVCLVGDNIRFTPGVARRVFASLGSVNVRMISQGASLLNLTIVVAESDLFRAVESLHREFFAQLDPAVFDTNGVVHAYSRRLAIVGYGKMGRLIEQLAPEYGFAVALKLDEFNNANGEGLTPANFAGIDAAIDFSIPAAVPGNVEGIAALGVNIVIGTTGWLGHLDAVKQAVDQNRIGLVWSPNYSIGVNAFFRLVAEAARLLSAQPEYGAWAWEIHHSTKKDAPSGTFLKLVEEMKRAGYPRAIDVGSNRAGAHPGTHEIGFDSAADTITLRHTARSREGFARGALKAAQWVVGKKGFHEFADIVFS